MEPIDSNAMTDEDVTRSLGWFTRTEPDGYAPPPLKDVLAYLEGRATAAQRVAVRAACLWSRSFRREIVELACGLEQLELPPAQDAFDAVAVPKAPTWEQFPAERAAARSDRGAAPSERALTIFGRTDAQTRRMVKRALAVSGAGAFVELVTSALSPLAARPFTPITLRSSGAPGPSAPSAAEAAIRSFVDRGQRTAGAFRPIDDRLIRSARRFRATGTSTITLVLVKGPGQEPVLHAAFALPADTRDLRAWVLLFPSLRLLYTPVTESPLRILWPVENEEHACLALTCAAEDGFQAVALAVEA